MFRYVSNFTNGLMSFVSPNPRRANGAPEDSDIRDEEMIDEMDRTQANGVDHEGDRDNEEEEEEEASNYEDAVEKPFAPTNDRVFRIASSFVCVNNEDGDPVLQAADFTAAVAAVVAMTSRDFARKRCSTLTPSHRSRMTPNLVRTTTRRRVDTAEEDSDDSRQTARKICSTRTHRQRTTSNGTSSLAQSRSRRRDDSPVIAATHEHSDATLSNRTAKKTCSTRIPAQRPSSSSNGTPSLAQSRSRRGADLIERSASDEDSDEMMSKRTAKKTCSTRTHTHQNSSNGTSSVAHSMTRSNADAAVKAYFVHGDSDETRDTARKTCSTRSPSHRKYSHGTPSLARSRSRRGMGAVEEVATNEDYDATTSRNTSRKTCSTFTSRINGPKSNGYDMAEALNSTQTARKRCTDGTQTRSFATAAATSASAAPVVGRKRKLSEMKQQPASDDIEDDSTSSLSPLSSASTSSTRDDDDDTSTVHEYDSNEERDLAIRAKKERRRFTEFARSVLYRKLQKNYEKLTGRKKNAPKISKMRKTPWKLKDENIDEKVYEGINKKFAEWDAKYRAAQASQFEVDYIVGGAHREMGDVTRPEKLLLKWEGYESASWEPADGLMKTILHEWNVRQAGLDFIEALLVFLMGKIEFKSLYPHRYLKEETGVGMGGYIQNKRSVYKCMLKAIEWRFNFELSKYDLPKIYIEDWTDEEEDWEALAAIKFIINNVISEGVHAALSKIEIGQLEHIKCSSSCGRCLHKHRSRDITHCCGMNISIDFVAPGRPEFITKGVPTKQTATSFECTDDCGCDPRMCRNRLLQFGRQQPLCIFRDHSKGWTLRTIEEIMKRGLVNEYCGKVLLGPTKDAGKIYDFELTYPLKRYDNTKRPLYISASGQGNETRFASHSCNPNCYMETTVIGRDDIFNTRVGMRASHNLYAGEEITFDYFDGRKLDDMHDLDQMFEYCMCGSVICRFSKEMVEAHRKKEEEDEDE